MKPALGSQREGALSAAPRVLVIEDEPGIVDFVRRRLEREGFEVETALDGVQGEELGVGGDFDVVVLDLMLPRRSGLEVLRSLHKARPTLPVIVLTARGEIEDRVAGLEAGAVDYLVKPFSSDELIARIRTHLRTLQNAADSVLKADGVEVDLLTRKVRFDGRAVALSTTELDLLTYLLRHRGQALSREKIRSAVWGYDHETATNLVDVYIGYLRRKLSTPERSVPIHTVRLVGYRFGESG